MESVIERMERIGAEEKIEKFRQMQRLPYRSKLNHAYLRIREFKNECYQRDLNCHVSVGGLDSIVLFLFIRKNGYDDVPGISRSSLEDASNRRVHQSLGIIPIGAAKDENGRTYTKPRIIQEFGFPVLSKEVASKVELLQHPSEDNQTVRHAIITGETGAYGGNRKGTRMKLAQRWLDLFGGYENETEGVNYQIPPEHVKLSSKCCYYLKEKPCEDWAKEHNSVPYLGLMASEGGRREKSLMINGCNYFGKTTIRSAPFAIFLRQDIIRLDLEMDEWYRTEYKFTLAETLGKNPDDMVESIIPKAYGEIRENTKGELYTTGAQRTGCDMCGFGIHLEKRPHRFDRLHESNPTGWAYWMKECCKGKDGESYGWGEILDYLGISWDFTPDGRMLNIDGQLSLFREGS